MTIVDLICSLTLFGVVMILALGWALNPVKAAKEYCDLVPVSGTQCVICTTESGTVSALSCAWK